MAALDLLWLYVSCCGPAVAVSILSAAVGLLRQSFSCRGYAATVSQRPLGRYRRGSGSMKPFFREQR